jgi:nicotinamide-nucleotide amidase
MNNFAGMNQSISASIITIGDEILIGQVIDTNSSHISQELNRIGIWVHRRVAVGDTREAIFKALQEEEANSDLIMITGGLGPTADDITKPVLAEYFGTRLVLNDQVLKYVEYLFDKVFKRGLPLLERNRKQAEVPESCTVLMNERGTAPGMWFNKGDKIFVSLPGVPHEMKGLLEKEVLPRLEKAFDRPYILHQTLLTAGTGESILAEHIKEWEENLPTHMRLAYLPNYGLVRLRLTTSGTDKNKLEKELESQFGTLKGLVKPWLVIDEDLTIAQAVAKVLKERKKTIGTAESCTGGYLAHLLSRDPGSSSNYKGSVISYDNQVKTDLLGVTEEILKEYGAVSEPTVRQMVKGALEVLKSDYVIATSGIMGPDGGSEKKPVGEVWIAVGSQQNLVAEKFNFRFDRARNMEITTITALNMVRKLIESEED